MEQVQCHGRASESILEKIRHIDTEQPRLRQLLDERVLHVVEHPRVSASGNLAPSRQACMNALCPRGICELDETGKSSSFHLEGQRAHQGMIEVGFLPDRERYSSANQRSQPGFQKLD